MGNQSNTFFFLYNQASDSVNGFIICRLSIDIAGTHVFRLKRVRIINVISMTAHLA